MPRPRKFRRVCCMPQTQCFGPLRTEQQEFGLTGPSWASPCCQIQMSIDEYETIRLIDLEGCTQEICAQQMGIARTTVQSIYNDARRKLADTLVHGKQLLITGGDYILCEHAETGCRRCCVKNTAGPMGHNKRKDEKEKKE